MSATSTSGDVSAGREGRLDEIVDAIGKPYFRDDAVVIYHADCRDILPLIPPESIDLVLTDPPYGINYVHGSENIPNASRFNEVPIVGDDKPFNPSPLLSFPRLILWGANHYADQLPSSRGWFIWDKRCNTVVNDQSDCELAWSNVSGTARIFYHVWDGFRRGTEKALPRVHPVQKPVALMKWCLQRVPDAQTILDVTRRQKPRPVRHRHRNRGEVLRDSGQEDGSGSASVTPDCPCRDCAGDPCTCSLGDHCGAGPNCSCCGYVNYRWLGYLGAEARWAKIWGVSRSEAGRRIENNWRVKAGMPSVEDELAGAVE